MTLSTNSKFTPRQLKGLHAAGRAAFQAIGGDAAHGPYDDWRRSTIQEITGCRGFSECRQSHYSSLMAHFSHLQGRDAEAFKSHMRAGRENEVDQAQTVWHLERACAELGYYIDPADPVAAGRRYALRIATDQFHLIFPSWDALKTHDPHRLTQLVFTLRNRTKSLARAAVDAVEETEPESLAENAPF